MANVWKIFEDMLPKRKQFIGQVDSINTAVKTCNITPLGGGNFTAKGIDNVVVGHWYIIENGVILREVPSLSMSDITIY